MSNQRQALDDPGEPPLAPAQHRRDPHRAADGFGLMLWPLAIGLIVALMAAFTRLDAERSPAPVALVADYGELTALAAFSGTTLDTTLAALREAGLTGVAVEEPTVVELVQQGALAVAPIAAPVAPGATELRPVADNAPGPEDVRLSVGADTAQVAEALSVLDARFGRAARARRAAGDPGLAAAAERSTGRPVRSVAAPWSAMRDAGAGLDPAAMAQVQAAGLAPVARLRNAPGLTGADIDRALSRAEALGAQMLIFSGDQVLGHRGLVDHTAEFLLHHRLAWGRVEFSAQTGEAGLAEQVLDAGGSYVRVHSITLAEMVKLPPALAVERFRRAVEERHIRVVFVRLLPGAAADALGDNVGFVRQIADAVRDRGYALGMPLATETVDVSPLTQVLVGLFGVMAVAAALWVWLSGRWSTPRWLAWWAVGNLLALLVFAVRRELFAEGLALLAALVYPSLGARWAWLQTVERRPRSVIWAFAVPWGAAAFSVAGGLCVVGLLSLTPYMLHHDQFAGVKLAQVVPLAFVAAMLAFGLSLPGTTGATVRERLRTFAREPILRWQVLLSLVALVLLAVLLIRSGNEGAEVSATELQVRALLERVFGARPRFKELLLGYPALALAAVAAWRGRAVWSGWLLLIGTIGLVSTFNTFCHLHTPLSQSLLRTFHALWMGPLLGLLLGLLLFPRPTHAPAGESQASV